MWTPNSVTFGLRHENVFGFLGRAGDILDAVRRAEGGRVIPSRLFENVQWPNPLTARMLNADGSVTVDFSIEGVILTVDLDEMGWSYQRARELFTELARVALPLSKGQDSVNRFGIIGNFATDHPSPGALAVDTLTSLRELGEPSDFTLRVAFRNPTERGMYPGTVDDWRNTILQVGTRKKHESAERPDVLRVSIDYQVYYAPQRTFSPALIVDHYEDFLRHVESLQRGPLAGLMPQEMGTADGR